MIWSSIREAQVGFGPQRRQVVQACYIRKTLLNGSSYYYINFSFHISVQFCPHCMFSSCCRSFSTVCVTPSLIHRPVYHRVVEDMHRHFSELFRSHPLTCLYVPGSLLFKQRTRLFHPQNQEMTQVSVAWPQGDCHLEMNRLTHLTRNVTFNCVHFLHRILQLVPEFTSMYFCAYGHWDWVSLNFEIAILIARI